MAATFFRRMLITDPERIAARRRKGLAGLVLDMVRPYRKWLLIILLALLLETVMSLAAPWPLKIIIDNVIGQEPLPHGLQWMAGILVSGAVSLAAVAAIAYVFIAAAGALAGYLNSYFTESVAQFVANDLRQRMYHHLQRLSLAYYDSHQVAKIISTLTTDVNTIQDFASQTLIRIFIDALTIAGMVGIMFYLHWDFALVAVGVTPFLLLFVARFKREVKMATREVRKDQSQMAAVLQQGLESIRAVEAFGRQDLEEQKLKQASMETVRAALKARKLKALLVPVVSITVAVCVALVLWRGATLVLEGVMTVGSLTVFLAYLAKFFSPVQDIAKLSNNVAQASVALERIQLVLDADITIREKPDAIQPRELSGHIVFDNVGFTYTGEAEVLHSLNMEIRA
ncbi:MAG TPA: ABC transporter ATP-binding protein, partial [Flavisolibacter sp.]